MEKRWARDQVAIIWPWGFSDGLQPATSLVIPKQSIGLQIAFRQVWARYSLLYLDHKAILSRMSSVMKSSLVLLFNWLVGVVCQSASRFLLNAVIRHLQDINVE